MASNQKSSLGDSSAPAVPFSYAQAAKGISSHASANSSRVASGAITPVTPAKENSATPSLKSEMAPGTSWADDVENGSTSKEKEKESHSTATTVVDGLQSPAATSPMMPPAHSQSNGILSPPSPDFGSSSTSTLAREDDASSVPISASDSTWENKSQGSHVPEKRQESADRAPSKGRKNNRGKKSDKSEEQGKDWSQPALPLHEAPIPVHNPWNKLRAAAAPKPAPVPMRPSPATAEFKPTTSKEAQVSNTNNVDAAKLDRPKPATPGNGDAPRITSDSRKDGEDRSTQRREPRAGAKGSERVEKVVSESPAPKVASPPMDQESWPTPDTVAERAHDKTEKSQKTQVETTPVPAPKGKSAWEKVDFTPTVVFNTPLPGNARRGGRGGGRGGRESNGRQPSGAPGEKSSTSQPAVTNGDSSRKGRPENPARGTSPSKGKRASSTEPATKRDVPTRTLKEVRPADANVPSESRTQKSSGAEEEPKQNANSQDNTLQRNGNSLRPKTARRTDAPTMTNGEKRKEGETGGKENEAIAASRRTSISNAPTENGDRKYSPPVDPATGLRYPTSERKSGNFGSFSSRDRPEGGHRGGRGGSRGGRNGAQAYHQNGQPIYPNAPIPGAAVYTPRSPTGYQQEPYFGHQPTHSRSFRGGPNRAQSNPVENYRGYSNGYGPNGLPQLNTFVGQNGMYDYPNMVAMSAAPYAQTPYVDPYSILPMVTQQMEYYFSVDNLCKDVFMRKHMDSQGFILLSFIADFKRLKTMTTDLELIKFVCQQSLNIEHRLGPDGLDRLRVRVGWEKWIMPVTERDPSAQNDGPPVTHTPPPPQVQTYQPRDQMRQASLPMSNASGAPMSAPPVPYQSLNGFAASYGNFGPNPTNDNHNFQTSPTSATNEAAPMVQPPGSQLASPHASQSGLANGTVEHEADSFSDEAVLRLRIIVRQPEPNAVAAPSAPVRSFSNGSLDGANVAEEMGIPAIASAAPLGGVAAVSDSRGSPAPTDRVASFLNQNGRLNPSRNGSSPEAPPSAPAAIFWMKDKDSPAHELAPDALTELYVNQRGKALEQRKASNSPACPHDMDVLYQFWSHFLIRNFNFGMYSEFRLLAEEDLLNHKSSVGRDNLVKFYSGALAHPEPVRHIVAKDYVDLVMAEPRDSDRFAYKQLRLAWRDGALNMKNRKRIKKFIGAQLEAELDGPA